MKSHDLLPLLAATALLTAGCNMRPTEDFYTDVVDACAYFGELLTPECRTALELVIPYDDSFDAAPAGFKEQVTNAFRAMIGYPMQLPPRNTLLGLDEFSIPLAHLRMLNPDEVAHPNLNKNLFNYTLNQLDVVHYGGPSNTNSAVYDYLAREGRRRVIIYDPFVGYSDPIGRAGVLAHEARHGDGAEHQPCPDSDSFVDSYAALLDIGGRDTCDASLTGPYGLEALTQELMLRGSWDKLTKFEISSTGQDICYKLKRVIHLPAGLKKLVHGGQCAYIDYDFMVEHEKLPRSP